MKINNLIHTLCFKKGISRTHITRLEYEHDIPKLIYTYFSKFTIANPIYKIRYKIPLDNRILDLDRYIGKLLNLYTVEVEFKTEEEAKSFVPPYWFGREVTYDFMFKNSSLIKYEDIYYVDGDIKFKN